MLAYGNATLLRSQACVDLDGLFGERLPHVLANLDRALERAKDRYYKEQDYAKFKMLFHLPGGTTGSYSRNLNRAARCPESHLHAIAATTYH